MNKSIVSTHGIIPDPSMLFPGGLAAVIWKTEAEASAGAVCMEAAGYSIRDVVIAFSSSMAEPAQAIIGRTRGGNFVESALLHGCGGMNIGTVRVPVPGRPAGDGRWPSNVVFLDDGMCSELDAMSGMLTSGRNCVRTKEGKFMRHGGLGGPGDVQKTYGDSGGASRFYPRISGGVDGFAAWLAILLKPPFGDTLILA